MRVRPRLALLAALGAAVALCLAPSPATAAPAELEWSQQSPTESPSARYGASMAYDGGDAEVVLFGGTNSGTYLNDTWTWDGTEWSLRPAPERPAARSGAGLAYDSASGQTILFGGTAGSTYPEGTWSWSGGSWHQLSPPLSPPGRTGAAIAYDAATEEVVLFGGYGPSIRADTWTWNGTTWTERSPAQSPPGQSAAAMAYDAATEELIFFGAAATGETVGSTWTWDGTTWTRLTPAHAPLARTGASLSYDPAIGELVLFGGRRAGASLDETWTWDGTDWTQMSPATPPAARELASMSIDADGHRIFLFGGRRSSAYLADTWAYGPPLGPPVARILGPADHGNYGYGEAVPTSFECEEAAGGPGLESCRDSNGASGGSGTLDTASPGPHTYAVRATSTDGLTADASIEYTVVKAAQTIAFGPLSARTLGDPDFGVSAASSSGLPVAFTSTTPAVCTVADASVHLRAVGICTIAADQPGNADYEAAATVPASFTVGAASSQAPDLTLDHTPNTPHKRKHDGDPRWTFHFSSGTPGATYFCSIDKASFKPCNSPEVYRNLKKGPHLFRVYAESPAGVRSTVRKAHFYSRWSG